jgi:hypothetical protein
MRDVNDGISVPRLLMIEILSQLQSAQDDYFVPETQDIICKIWDLLHVVDDNINVYYKASYDLTDDQVKDDIVCSVTYAYTLNGRSKESILDIRLLLDADKAFKDYWTDKMFIIQHIQQSNRLLERKKLILHDISDKPYRPLYMAFAKQNMKP